MNNTIILKDLMVGRDYPTAGGALFDIIRKYISTNDRIIINMDGVDSLPSMFLNTSIGQFIDNYGKDLLRQKISFTKITRTQALRLQDYLSRY